MRLVTGAAERGPIASSAVVVGALAVLAVAVFTGLRTLEIAPVIAVTILAALAYRWLLAWRTLIAATILVILLIPIRRYEMPGNLPFELEPYRFLVAIVAAGWLASLLADPRVRFRGSLLDKPLVVIAFAAAASIIVNGDRVQSSDIGSVVGKDLTFLLSFFIVFYLLVSVVRRHVDLEFLVKILVGGGVVVAIFALVEANTHHNVFNSLGNYVPLLRLTDVADTGDLSRGTRLRVYGSAQHPIALAAVLVMLLPLAIYLARATRQRLWWLAGAVLLAAALATVSRTAVLMLLAAGIVLLWLRPVDTRRLWPLIIPAALAVHLALPGTIGTLRQSFFPEGGLIAEQQKHPGSVGSGRLADVGPSLDEAAAKPLLGYGYGTRIVEGPNTNARILDNQWLGTLLEIGIIGLAAWFWLFARFIRRLGRLAKHDTSNHGWLLAAIVASVCAYAVGMLTFDAFSFIQVTFVLFILLALGCAAYAEALARSARGVAAR